MRTLPDRVSATGVVTFGMPNALPRVAEPDEHRIQITDVFSTIKGRHTFKFGGDVNIVHEVMINLFQGGGIYSYGDANTLFELPGLDPGRLRRDSPEIPTRTPVITTTPSCRRSTR